MRPLLSSDFNRRIIIEKPVSTTNAVGQEAVVWTTKATLWAKVQFRNETRSNAQGVEVIGQVLLVTTRLKSNLSTTDRILYDGRVYRIDSAVPDDTNRHTLIRAYANDRD